MGSLSSRSAPGELRSEEWEEDMVEKDIGASGGRWAGGGDWWKRSSKLGVGGLRVERRTTGGEDDRELRPFKQGYR